MAKNDKINPIVFDGMKVYTIPDLIELLHLTKWTLRTHIRAGRLKAKKIGRSYYITEDALKEFFEAKTETKE